MIVKGMCKTENHIVKVEELTSDAFQIAKEEEEEEEKRKEKKGEEERKKKKEGRGSRGGRKGKRSENRL
jgi:hypothetical protein